jgi:hypothetical protein
MPAIHSSSRHHTVWRRAVKHCRYYHRFRHRASKHRHDRKRLYLQTQRKDASTALYSVHPAIAKRLQGMSLQGDDRSERLEEPG